MNLGKFKRYRSVIIVIIIAVGAHLFQYYQQDRHESYIDIVAVEKSIEIYDEIESYKVNDNILTSSSYSNIADQLKEIFGNKALESYTKPEQKIYYTLDSMANSLYIIRNPYQQKTSSEEVILNHIENYEKKKKYYLEQLEQYREKSEIVDKKLNEELSND